MPSETHLVPSWTHLRAQSHIPSATWRLLGATWRSKPHSKCNLVPPGSIFGAPATLRLELPPARELHFEVFLVFLNFKTGFGAQRGAHRGALGPHLVVLGHLLGSTWRLLGSTWLLLASIWSLLGASWGHLGASWAPLGLNLEPLGANSTPLGTLLEVSWPYLGSKWSPNGLQVCSKWPPSGLPVLSKSLSALSKAFERFIQACCSASGCA